MGRPLAGVEVELATRVLQDLDVLASDLLAKLLHVNGHIAHICPLAASLKDNPCPDGGRESDDAE